MAAFTSLAHAIKELTVNKDTKVVNLTGVDVRDAGFSDLAFALRKCSAVRELILSDCKLGPQAAVHLATFLKYNKTVTRLYLQHNPGLGDKGIEEIALVLKVNKFLQVLNLSGCAVTDTGAAALAENLPHATSLKKVYLYNNNIGYIGALALAELIQEHPAALEELFMWDNPITEPGLEALRDSYESAREIMKDTGLPFLQLVTGLKNEKVAKKKAPADKRNYKVPTKPGQDKGPIIDDSSTGDFAALRAKAQSLESSGEPNTPVKRGPPPKISLIDLPKNAEPEIDVKKSLANVHLFENPALASQHRSSSFPEKDHTLLPQKLTVQTMVLESVTSPMSPSTNNTTILPDTRRKDMELAHAPQKYSPLITTTTDSGKIGQSSMNDNPEDSKRIALDDYGNDLSDGDSDDAASTDIAAEAAKLEEEIAALQEQLAAKKGNIRY